MNPKNYNEKIKSPPSNIFNYLVKLTFNNRIPASIVAKQKELIHSPMYRSKTPDSLSVFIHKLSKLCIINRLIQFKNAAP